MELDKFIQHFAAQFEDTDASQFTAETRYKELAEWSSLMALSIIGMVDEEYEAKVKGDDIRNTQTIKDLYEIVKSRM